MINRYLTVLLLFVFISNTLFSQLSYTEFQKKTSADQGLFTTYLDKDKLYFEVPDSLLGRELLLGARVSELSDFSKVVAGEMRKNPILVSFSREDNSLLLHHHGSKYEGFTEQNIYHALQRHKLLPILTEFPIVCFSPDSSTMVIEVSSFFKNEIKLISPFNAKYKLGAAQSAQNRILSAKSFPENIEIRSRMGYTENDGSPIVVVMHRSLILLPKETMRPRLEDERVGYFSVSRYIFDENHTGMLRQSYIKRYNIYPRPEDLEKYQRGELVEPEHPIVYYVDSAFPAKLQEGIFQGITYWQKAFEAIGFKNAIRAEPYPEKDPHFNPDDIRYSCVRYVTQERDNAMGPHWVDPRSGQVICGDILWWHDVTIRLRNWLFVQCAAAEPLVRGKEIHPDLLRDVTAYVIAHEVGHNLGLKHNMRASYAFSVDSLRSASFTQKYGHTASIMDYARFNYVAQPEDQGVRFLPMPLGTYDYHAIRWGYQPIPEANSPEEESHILHQWLQEKENDPIYSYGPQQVKPCIDPTAQTEDLGNDAIKASSYGINNLRYIMEHFVSWTSDFSEVENTFTKEIYMELVKQCMRYFDHVRSNIGGVYRHYPFDTEEEGEYRAVPKNYQQKALNWIYTELQELPSWIYPKEYEKLAGPQQEVVYEFQAKILDALMNKGIFERLATYSKDYSPYEYLSDLHHLVWNPSIEAHSLSSYQKHLQACFVRNITNMSDFPEPSLKNVKESGLGSPMGQKKNHLDNLITPIFNLERDNVIELLDKLKRKTRDPLLKAHYDYLYKIIRE